MDTQYLQRDATFHFSGEVFKHAKLPPGVYGVNVDYNGNPFLVKQNLNTDDLIKMPNSVAGEINTIVDEFLNDNIKAAFERYGILYKRGILMYGPPGTGKTCIINQLIETAVKKNMVILLGVQPGLVNTVVSKIREIEQDNRAVMVVWEEFEDWICDSKSSILNLLDGIQQIDNTMYVATTNYIDQIPQRIRNRPSRFANVIEVGFPTAEVRRIFLKSKIHEDDEVDLDRWVEMTQGLAIDHLKDLIISVLVLHLPFDESLKKLRNLGKEETEYDYEGDDECCKAEPCGINGSSNAPIIPQY